MPSARPVLVALVLAALLVPPATSLSQQAISTAPIAIIVHPSNPVETLTLGELRRIFMLDTQTWPHGRKITVVLRDKGQPERTEAIRMICGVTEHEYERQILFRTFQGSVNIGPRAIQSAAAMLRFVHSAPGAIGYRSEERRVGKECRSRWSPYH